MKVLGTLFSHLFFIPDKKKGKKGDMQGKSIYEELSNSDKKLSLFGGARNTRSYFCVLREFIIEGSD